MVTLFLILALMGSDGVTGPLSDSVRDSDPPAASSPVAPSVLVTAPSRTHVRTDSCMIATEWRLCDSDTGEVIDAIAPPNDQGAEAVLHHLVYMHAAVPFHVRVDAMYMPEMAFTRSGAAYTPAQVYTVNTKAQRAAQAAAKVQEATR